MASKISRIFAVFVLISGSGCSSDHQKSKTLGEIVDELDPPATPEEVESGLTLYRYPEAEPKYQDIYFYVDDEIHFSRRADRVAYTLDQDTKAIKFTVEQKFRKEVLRKLNKFRETHKATITGALEKCHSDFRLHEGETKIFESVETIAPVLPHQKVKFHVVALLTDTGLTYINAVIAGEKPPKPEGLKAEICFNQCVGDLLKKLIQKDEYCLELDWNELENANGK